MANGSGYSPRCAGARPSHPAKTGPYQRSLDQSITENSSQLLQHFGIESARVQPDAKKPCTSASNTSPYRQKCLPHKVALKALREGQPEECPQNVPGVPN